MLKNIRFIRKSLNLSQKEFAEKIGKSLKYIKEIEHADFNLPVLKFLQICYILKVDPIKYIT